MKNLTKCEVCNDKKHSKAFKIYECYQLVSHWQSMIWNKRTLVQVIKFSTAKRKQKVRNHSSVHVDKRTCPERTHEINGQEVW